MNKDSYAPLTIQECEEGMIVVLTHPDPGYHIGTTNPAINTQYFCKGRIRRVGEGSISVTWDNGSHNSYKNGEISLVTPRMRSIW